MQRGQRGRRSERHGLGDRFRLQLREIVEEGLRPVEVAPQRQGVHLRDDLLARGRERLRDSLHLLEVGADVAGGGGGGGIVGHGGLGGGRRGFGGFGLAFEVGPRLRQLLPHPVALALRDLQLAREGGDLGPQRLGVGLQLLDFGAAIVAAAGGQDGGQREQQDGQAAHGRFSQLRARTGSSIRRPGGVRFPRSADRR